MKVVSFKQIKDLNINMLTYYTWANEVFMIKGECQLPPKISMKKEGHIFFNIMPSIIDKIKVAGVKVVDRFPERNPSLDSQIMLYNSNNGENIAFMDGNIITAYRTGAVAALAINTLAIENYETVGILGLGVIARATFDILVQTLNGRKINVKLLKYKNAAELFVERYKEYSFIDFEIVETTKELIENSDVVISCVTSADKNFGEDEWFKEGCLVVPVHTMGFQNCDLFFDKVIVDDIGHVNNFKYFDKFKEVHELTDVLNNNKLGRINNKERILAYNIGNSIFDIYFAKKIYDLLEKQNLQTIDLEIPTEKFWI